jgi:hypothetical protein
MTRWLRRIVVLSLLGGTADLVRRKLKRADEIKPSDYRPFVPVIPPPVAKATPTVEAPTVEAPTVEAPAVEAPEPVETTPASESLVASDWVEPVDGVCPVSHPIKGNDQSKIFHVPGGASYERTVPERCYVSAAAAEADGYRPSKR